MINSYICQNGTEERQLIDQICPQMLQACNMDNLPRDFKASGLKYITQIIWAVPSLGSVGWIIKNYHPRRQLWKEDENDKRGSWGEAGRNFPGCLQSQQEIWSREAGWWRHSLQSEQEEETFSAGEKSKIVCMHIDDVASPPLGAIWELLPNDAGWLMLTAFLVALVTEVEPAFKTSELVGNSLKLFPVKCVGEWSWAWVWAELGNKACESWNVATSGDCNDL